MSIKVEVRVEGQQAVITRVDRRMGLNLDRAIQGAAMDAARSLRPAIRAAAPRSAAGARGAYAHPSGNLAAATRVARLTGRDRPGAYVGPSRSKAHYRHMVTGGHATRSGGRVEGNDYVTRAASAQGGRTAMVFTESLKRRVGP